MSKPDQRDTERPRAAPISSRWHPRSHCSAARAQLISNVKAMKLHRTGLWDMRGRWGVHAKDTMLRSGRVGERKKKTKKLYLQDVLVLLYNESGTTYYNRVFTIIRMPIKAVYLEDLSKNTLMGHYVVLDNKFESEF